MISIGLRRDSPGSECEPRHARAPCRATRTRQGLLDVACRTVDQPFGPLLLAATLDGRRAGGVQREDHGAVLARLATKSARGSCARRGDWTRRRGSSTSTSPASGALRRSRRSAAGPRVPPLGAPAPARDRLRHARELHRSGEGGRATLGGPGRGQRLLAQSAAPGRALPPRGPQRRSFGEYLGGPKAKHALLAMEAGGERA